MKVFLRNNDIGYFEEYFYQKPEYVSVILSCKTLTYKNIKYTIISSPTTIPDYHPHENCEAFVDIFVEPIIEN